MKRLLPWIVLVFAALWIASNSRIPKAASESFDLVGFGKIPVLGGGRQKPLDTVARNSLVIMHGRQTIRLADGRKLQAIDWLADTFFNPSAADSYPVFLITNPEVLGLFGWQQTDRKFFSFQEISSFLQKVDEEGQKVDAIESARRTAYQTAVFNLRNGLILYQRLKNSIRPENAKDFVQELEAYEAVIPAGLEAAGKREKNESFNKEALEALAGFANRYGELENMGYILPVPPRHHPGHSADLRGKDWLSVGSSLIGTLATREVDAVVKAYARMSRAYQGKDAALFNQEVKELAQWMGTHEPRASGRSAFEFLFNWLAPFYQAMGIYVLAFLMVCAAWLSSQEWSRQFGRAAFFLLVLALVVHSFGLGARMYLQERPPVTNLYSSAIFIGWGTVIIGLFLERYFRDGVGALCAAVIGFITLIIAHHLAGSGDTLEMLQAVLDTNIWLATHVVVITIGYSAMFLAGALAAIYVVRGVFTRTMSKQSADALSRMIYGVICFATLFSFVGTVLGGIWADQSWGRFWGWDPKENGALMIVLWCAIILHARWGGYIRQRGLMALTLFGNVITSFSWFGVNMLGVGLHSYGFMNKAVPWLAAFMVANLVLMGLAALPTGLWRSFKAQDV